MLRVRGIRRRSITADTERERREKEFKIMREIQREASTTNKLFGLWFAVISFSVLWFIGAVVFWKASHATGGEEWTYFESLYFVGPPKDTERRVELELTATSRTLRN